MRRRTLVALIAAALVAASCVALERGGNPYYDPAKPHHTSTGFRNNYTQIEGGGFWKWQWQRWTGPRAAPPPGGWAIPVTAAHVAFLAANREATTVTWIGHATLLVQVAGRNLLTDPQFSDRASPVTFAGPARLQPPAIAIDALPRIHAVLISHNHYDHLDLPSLERLARQPGGPPAFFVPLGLKAWFRRQGLPDPVELDWWDARDAGGVEVHAVPVQHWSARTPLDRNRTLWCGYVVRAPGFSLAFLGDTGYSPDFAEIGRRFPGLDLALIPIVAYEPRWFMHRQHVDPAEAVAIHRDLGARASIGVHWGTFPLSDEPMDEPPRALARAVRASGLPAASVTTMAIGETRTLPTRSRDAGPVS